MSHEQIIAALDKHEASYTVREHAAVRTVADVMAIIPEYVDTMVKTIAFRVKDGEHVLAAAMGKDRIDYKKLATLVGVNRRNLRTLSPDEVRNEMGFVVGGVTPVPIRPNVRVIVDAKVAGMEMVSIGGGVPTITLSISAETLLSLPGIETVDITK